MEGLKKRAYAWVVSKYRLFDAIPEADKIIQELLIEVESLERSWGTASAVCNILAGERNEARGKALVDAYIFVREYFPNYTTFPTTVASALAKNFGLNEQKIFDDRKAQKTA